MAATTARWGGRVLGQTGKVFRGPELLVHALHQAGHEDGLASQPGKLEEVQVGWIPRIIQPVNYI